MDFFMTPQGRRLAYRTQAGIAPGLVFLGGYKSDMEGSKAQFLHEMCARQDRSFLRFDYSGHGSSDGAFADGCIGDWYEDALAAITSLTTGPQVLIGSSMGGWISLLIAREHPERVAGLVTIAAAPDFATAKWDSLTASQRAIVEERGYHQEPSDYGEDYIFTKRLFDDGANRRVMNAPLPLPFPVRMVQGTDDNAVSMATATSLLTHATGDDISLELVRGKDHSFSDPECLRLLEAKIAEVVARI